MSLELAASIGTPDGIIIGMTISIAKITGIAPIINIKGRTMLIVVKVDLKISLESSKLKFKFRFFYGVGS
ncbi:MAG: hypothetical protein YK1309IOTA_1750006 [Marine Group I thaumarchaeote]|nr:MAG: hypothetical protein YK1309IOTA_1750006 [Marine Group I thaumarchaeote]